MGARLSRPVRPGQRPADHPRGLTTQQPHCASEDNTWNTPDSEVRQITAPTVLTPR